MKVGKVLIFLISMVTMVKQKWIKIATTTIIIRTVQFSQQLFLTYRKTEDNLHQLFQNQIIGHHMQPTCEHPVEWGIARVHPTKPEAAAVWWHIGWAGDDNSTDRQTGSIHVPTPPEALNLLLTNYFGNCLRMKNLEWWNYPLGDNDEHFKYFSKKK